MPAEFGRGGGEAVGKIGLAAHAEAVAVAVERWPLLVICRLHLIGDAVSAHHTECVFGNNAVAEVAHTAAGEGIGELYVVIHRADV